MEIKMENTIINKLIEYVSLMEDISKDEITETTDIVKDFDMDSLEIVEMISFLEEEFNIRIDSVGEKPYTIKHIAENIAKLI